MSRTAIERVMDRVDALPDGCIIFTGSLSEDGYGWIRDGERMRRAHQVAFEAAHGPIPDGLEIDHTCSVRNCVNPQHLEAVSHAENVRRSRARGCIKRKHPWTPENTMWESGSRRCRACRVISRARAAA